MFSAIIAQSLHLERSEHPYENLSEFLTDPKDHKFLFLLLGDKRQLPPSLEHFSVGLLRHHTDKIPRHRQLLVELAFPVVKDTLEPFQLHQSRQFYPHLILLHNVDLGCRK